MTSRVPSVGTSVSPPAEHEVAEVLVRVTAQRPQTAARPILQQQIAAMQPCQLVLGPWMNW